MDSTLNDFLNEINEIAPLKNTKNSSNWKQCVDEKSGFSYYWNTETNEVTWDKPKNFIPSKSVASNNSLSTFGSSTSIAPEILDRVRNTVKIYNIASNCNEPLSKLKKNEDEIKETGKGKIVAPKFLKPSDCLNDEKITLITSYGSDSESDDETEQIKKQDEVKDILSTVKKKPEELNQNEVSKPKHEKSISGFSLLAGYESYSENDDSDEEKETKNATGHSTLFPIVQPVNVDDFIKKDPSTTTKSREEDLSTENFDTKNFQRKRRLGVTFSQKSTILPETDVENAEIARKGLGFNPESSTLVPKKNLYENFKSGGVEFEKSEDKQENSDNFKEIEENYEILHEKLSFLCEGNKDILPVQIIKIQIETLFGALRSNCLKPSYLQEWLEGTSEDLIKLEKEAAPEGWLLQWDRSLKRYYYHNKETNMGQWEYPNSEHGNEDAMDISTTPPHSNEEDELIPRNENPTPPPPPVISTNDEIRPPEPPKISRIIEINNEPLPPGVDSPEPPKNDINNAIITSFYSELAAIEEAETTTAQNEPAHEPESVLQEPPKKKKKKIKLGQGLSLKKKDVSKLVEKWKSVQNNY